MNSSDGLLDYDKQGQKTLEYLKDPVIDNFLGGFYKKEYILAHKYEELEDGSYKILFVFPEYEKTEEPLAHVSDNLLNQAVMEGVYISAGLSAMNGTLGDISLNDIKAVMSDVKLREKYFKYNKEIAVTGNKTYASCSFRPGTLTNVKNRFSTLNVDFQGEHFKGYMKAVLPSNIAVEKIIEGKI